MSDLVERLRKLTGDVPPRGHVVLAEEAVARIEQLEAALRFMLTDPPAALDEPDTDAEIIQHYREVARAALGPSFTAQGQHMTITTTQMFEHIKTLEARIEQLEAALGQCAAAFATSPGTVGQCQSEISTEFQRRMDIAGAALAPEQEK